MTIAVGVGLPMTGANEVTRFARAAEERGFDHVSISDVQLGDGTPCLEPLIVAGLVAGLTRRVRIEFGVLVAPTRELARFGAQIAALQHLSGERVVLGLGIGGFPRTPLWNAVGAASTGRGRAVEEMLTTLPGLLRGEPTSIRDSSLTLAPPASPPPMLVGGHAEVARRRAVRYGDGWFPSLMPRKVLAERIALLRSEARSRRLVHYGTHAALGPDAGERRAEFVANVGRLLGIPREQAAELPLAGSPAEVAEQLASLADAGIDSVTVALDGAEPDKQLDLLAEARDLLRR